MSSKGNSIKLSNGLTQKQNAFTNGVLEQIAKGEQVNGTEIAMQVYDTKDKATAGAIAKENFQKPAIQEVLQEALSSVGLSVEGSLKQIQELAEHKYYKMSGETKLKANIEILKLLGAYPGSEKGGTKVQNNVFIGMNFDEARQKLEEINGNANDFITEATDL